jgi:thiamine biosynthesis protein ThiS
MHVTLNGESREVPGPLTVATLLSHLDIDARRVAVEVNEAVVKRARYDETPIQPDDVIEIVNFVGGG